MWGASQEYAQVFAVDARKTPLTAGASTGAWPKTRNAWTAFKATPAGQAVTAFHHRAQHPTADKPGGPITRKDLFFIAVRAGP